MPDDVISELKHVLKKELAGYGDNACKAFLLAMVSMIGGYRKALKFREVRREREGERNVCCFCRIEEGERKGCTYVHVVCFRVQSSSHIPSRIYHSTSLQDVI